MTNSQIQALTGMVSDSNKTPRMGSFRTPRRILRIHVEVLEAFNSDGGDTLEIGHADDPDAYCTSIDVSSTGVKSVTLGSGVNYDAVSRAVIATYAAGGSAPTTGAVDICIEWIQSPKQP